MKNNPLDQFYTKDEVAKKCYEILTSKIEVKDYSLFLEPSAGCGAFLFLMPENNRIGLDLDPKTDEVKKANFFEYIPQTDTKNIVVGNPPFGKRGKTSLDFFQHASTFASTISFVLPLQWRKWSLQKFIDKKWKLIHDSNIEKDAFVVDGKAKDIGCCFQIWTVDETKHEDLRLKSKPNTSHPDFEMFLYNNTKQAEKFFDYEWDFAVPRQGFYDFSIKKTSKEECDKKIQWIFFKAKNKEILDKLYQIDFPALSRKNTTIPGWGKADLVEEYNKLAK